MSIASLDLKHPCIPHPLTFIGKCVGNPLPDHLTSEDRHQSEIGGPLVLFYELYLFITCTRKESGVK